MMADALQRPPVASLAVPALTAPGIAEVYETHVDYVWRCLRSLGVQGAALDDAVQDVFLVVQAKLVQFDGRHRLRTWLYAIVIRVARRYRSRAARQASEAGAGEPATHQTPEHSLEQNEQLAVAEAALANLDYEKREVFVLAHVEQMSAPEIADVTGLPVNTVYSRLRAARHAFKEQVDRIRQRGSRRYV